MVRGSEWINIEHSKLNHLFRKEKYKFMLVASLNNFAKLKESKFLRFFLVRLVQSNFLERINISPSYFPRIPLSKFRNISSYKLTLNISSYKLTLWTL